jgi:hypothetical protein
MANTSATQRAARGIKSFEAVGKQVVGVSITGNTVEFRFKHEDQHDELGFIDFKAAK